MSTTTITATATATTRSIWRSLTLRACQIAAREAHEHAANTHEETAAFMDAHGQPDKAAFHRDAADRNRLRAHEESMKAAEYDI
jgi:hypothetical protein